MSLRLVLALGLSFSGSVWAAFPDGFTYQGGSCTYADGLVVAGSCYEMGKTVAWNDCNDPAPAHPQECANIQAAQCETITGAYRTERSFNYVKYGYCRLPGDYVPPDPNPCPAKAGQQAVPSGKVAYGENAEGVNPINAVLCSSDLCIMKINHATTIPIGGGKQANYITNATYTGAKAASVAACPLTVTVTSPKDPTLPKPIDTVTPDADTPDGVPTKGDDCPPGSAFGQVNGVNVCSPSGSQIAYVPETTTQTNNGQTTTSTVQKTAEVQPDGSVKTTSTITTSSGGVGSVTTTTKISGGPSGTNGRDGKDGNSIDGIDLGPAPHPESVNPTDFLPGPGPGQDGAGQGARTFAVTPQITGGSTACLADRSVTAMGVVVTIPLSALCPWFDVMYNLVSVFAVFSALRILVMS